MWFLRRMLRISWTDHVTNEEVLRRRAGTERNLLRTIWRRQIEFLGHVMRKEGLENLMLMGRIEGKRDRGRQRRKFLGALKEQVAKNWRNGIRASKILHITRDRKNWNIMIVNICGQGTQKKKNRPANVKSCETWNSSSLNFKCRKTGALKPQRSLHIQPFKEVLSVVFLCIGNAFALLLYNYGRVINSRSLNVSTQFITIKFINL